MKQGKSCGSNDLTRSASKEQVDAIVESLFVGNDVKLLQGGPGASHRNYGERRETPPEFRMPELAKPSGSNEKGINLRERGGKLVAMGKGVIRLENGDHVQCTRGRGR